MKRKGKKDSQIYRGFQRKKENPYSEMQYLFLNSEDYGSWKIIEGKKNGKRK